MDKETMDKFYELYLDMLQDARADARTEEKYDTSEFSCTGYPARL